MVGAWIEGYTVDGENEDSGAIEKAKWMAVRGGLGVGDKEDDVQDSSFLWRAQVVGGCWYLVLRWEPLGTTRPGGS